MESIRCFVALPLPESVRSRVGALQEELRASPWTQRVRWVPPENFHVTLQFLGRVPPSRHSGIAAALEKLAAARASFDWVVGGVTALPSPSRARVIVARVEGDDSVGDLAAGVARALAPLGFQREARRFRPHLTLGRVRKPPLRGERIERPGEAIVCPADEIVLFASELAPSGARYRRIGSWPLRSRG